MIGRRVYPGDDGELRLAAGDYGKDQYGVWHARPPSISVPGLKENQHPLSGTLENHEVTEHEDGTITASPSILITYPYGNPQNGSKQIDVSWHGYLRRGVWSTC